MKLPSVVALCAVVLLVAPATAQDLGERPPEFDAVKWYNTPPLSLEALTGKAILVDVFRTTWAPCRQQVPILNSAFEKDEGKGMVVLGVTTEEVALVDRWVRATRPVYPIVVLKDRAFEEALAIKGFPTAAVIDSEGVLTHVGGPGSWPPSMKVALEDTEKDPLYPKKLSRVRRAIMEDDDPAAWSELTKLVGKSRGDEELDLWIARFQELLQARSADALVAARQCFEDGLVYAAVQLADRIVDTEPPVDAHDGAAALLEEMLVIPTYKSELKGGPMYAEAEQLEVEGEYAEAAKRFLKVLKKYPDTLLATAAMARAREIARGGMAGFSPGCESCTQVGQACSRHSEDIEL